MRGPYLYSSQRYWWRGSVSYLSGAEPVWLPPSMFLVILEGNTALLCKRIITSLYPMMSLSSYPPWPHEDTQLLFEYSVSWLNSPGQASLTCIIWGIQQTVIDILSHQMKVTDKVNVHIPSSSEILQFWLSPLCISVLQVRSSKWVTYTSFHSSSSKHIESAYKVLGTGVQRWKMPTALSKNTVHWRR